MSTRASQSSFEAFLRNNPVARLLDQPYFRPLPVPAGLLAPSRESRILDSLGFLATTPLTTELLDGWLNYPGDTKDAGIVVGVIGATVLGYSALIWLSLAGLIKVGIRVTELSWPFWACAPTAILWISHPVANSGAGWPSGLASIQVFVILVTFVAGFARAIAICATAFGKSTAWLVDRFVLAPAGTLAAVLFTCGMVSVVASYLSRDSQWISSLLLNTGVSFLFGAVIDIVAETQIARYSNPNRRSMQATTVSETGPDSEDRRIRP